MVFLERMVLISIGLAWGGERLRLVLEWHGGQGLVGPGVLLLKVVVSRHGVRRAVGASKVLLLGHGHEAAVLEGVEGRDVLGILGCSHGVGVALGEVLRVKLLSRAETLELLLAQELLVLVLHEVEVVESGHVVGMGRVEGARVLGGVRFPGVWVEVVVGVSEGVGVRVCESDLVLRGSRGEYT
jgi:hypothetical protein